MNDVLMYLLAFIGGACFGSAATIAWQHKQELKALQEEAEAYLPKELYQNTGHSVRRTEQQPQHYQTGAVRAEDELLELTWEEK